MFPLVEIQALPSRGNRGQTIYGDLTDRAFWLGLCSQTVHECSWLCHAYCQMTNHFHLLVETPEANVIKLPNISATVPQATLGSR